MFTIGAFAVIFDDQDRVLLCHRRDLDIWNLPGGGMEPGETPDQTAIRETREETGLEIAIKRLVGVYSKSYSNDVVFVFEAGVIGGTLMATSESDKSQYFAAENLPVNTIPHHMERLLDVVAQYAQPIFRCQTGPSTKEYLAQLKNIQEL